MQRPQFLSRATTHPLPWYLDVRRLGIASVEMFGTVGALFIYFFVRGGRPDDIESSLTRGLQIIDLEQRLGIFTELQWQKAFLPYDLLMDIANQVYAWGHYPVLAAIGTWLAIKNPSRFRFIRNVMLLSGVVGIAAYWLLPTAPPRLIHLSGIDFGFVDTVHGSADVVYLQPAPFVNDFAALPSFHFGWIALASAAIWVNTTNPFLRAFAVAMSVVMWWAIVVTGNHFFIDMVLGGLVVAVSWVAVAYLDRIGVSARLTDLLFAGLRRMRHWVVARLRPRLPDRLRLRQRLPARLRSRLPDALA
ncbi:MAG: phosphatase PAP2 family protein [Chloroflexi bacterium]|nr:phosphatase PAP2 family protein [Chloroflexota bacterium]